ncbi:MAG: glycosyltransferase [Myxococcales bacterium]
MRKMELDETLRGRDIVCFSNDWDGDPLSKTHIMRLLARENRVLWVNSLGNRAPTLSTHDLKRVVNKLKAAAESAREVVKEVEKNIFVLAPLAVPVFGSELVRRVNKVVLKAQLQRAMKHLGFNRPIVWSFLPSAEWVAGSLDSELLIYHCVDEFSAFSDAPGRLIAEAEERLVKSADMVITSAERLQQSKSALNANTCLVRHGVDWEHFSKALDPDLKVPEDMAKLAKPVIGFFGLVADWVDIELIEKVARAYPDASVVIIGSVRTDVSKLGWLPNVHFLGRKKYAELPAYCRGFDVALMPFRINELTLNANPLKVREYLAAGLPVVSTNIPEVTQLGQCLIGNDHDEFIAKVGEALKDGGPSRARSEAIRHESWAAKVEEIRDHVRAFTRKGPARRRQAS